MKINWEYVKAALIRRTIVCQTIMRRSPSAGLMLGQRLRRWPNINPAPDEHPAFSMTVVTCQPVNPAKVSI